MKNKIALKLFLYFSTSLIIFSIIIGSIFITLFKKHTLDLHKADLDKRADKIADTLSEIMSNIGGSTVNNNMMGKMGGYGSYIRFLDDIAMADVWIVDENLKLITIGHMSDRQYNYSDLPQDADMVVKEVFKGGTTFSEGFSKLLNTPTLTIGKPISSGDVVIGALLLHSPVDGMKEAAEQGFEILLISNFFALIFSFAISAALAVYFTNPLKKMKNTAFELAGGNYTKTNVSQNDEIGELASTIDVLSDKLNAASKESENLQNLRKNFIANISHELRTPVTVIRGSLEALCDEVVSNPEQIKEYHHQMLNESIYLQRLVNDLLDLTRLQSTDFKIEINKLNLCDALNDVVRSSKNLAQSKNIEIKYYEDTQNFTIDGDYGRLRQMFLIIIENAVKFSFEHSVVEVRLEKCKVTVRDSGIGIEAEEIPYIFERFYKIRSETNKDGTGLGLAIAKQIAERHNIEITVKSKPNEGTEFCFTFKCNS